MGNLAQLIQDFFKALFAALQKARPQTPVQPQPAPVVIPPNPTPTPVTPTPPTPKPEPAPQSSGFLICPIQASDSSGKSVTSRTAKISAVVDHSGTAIDPQSTKSWGKNAKDQKVKAFNGEIGQGPQCSVEPCGYPNSDSTEFFSNKEINYVGVASDGGKKVLQYDGHAGYDFSYPLGTQIVAPAGGKLCKAKSGDDLIYNASWGKDHSFYIKHDNGFVTWFRHCNTLEDLVEQKIAASSDGLAQVSQGEKIARLGNFEMSKIGGTAVHLHFETRNPAGKIVDPYGDKLWQD